jgi:hypothetical protein
MTKQMSGGGGGTVMRLVAIAGGLFLVIHFAMMARIQTGHQTGDTNEQSSHLFYQRYLLLVLTSMALIYR